MALTYPNHLTLPAGAFALTSPDGSLRVVTEWATRRRRADRAEGLHRVPSARTLARMMTTGRDNLSRSETITIAAIEESLPALVEARTVIGDFHTMIRKRAITSLEARLIGATA